jgi:hypothetical protein
VTLVGVGVTVSVAVGRDVVVDVAVGVLVGIEVAVGAGVDVDVPVGTLVGVDVAVGDSLGVSVDVDVGSRCAAAVPGTALTPYTLDTRMTSRINVRRQAMVRRLVMCIILNPPNKNYSVKVDLTSS